QQKRGPVIAKEIGCAPDAQLYVPTVEKVGAVVHDHVLLPSEVHPGGNARIGGLRGLRVAERRVDHRLRAVRCDAHASQRIAKGCRQARSRYYREGGADDTENEGDDEETPARARDHGPPPLSAPSPAATDSSARPRTAVRTPPGDR